MNEMVFENAEVIYRNFQGADPRGYNEKHNRTFEIVVGPDRFDELTELGYPLKNMPNSEEPRMRFKCFVSFVRRPPEIWIITEKGKVKLDEETVSSLDYADVINWDVETQISKWTDKRTGDLHSRVFATQIYAELRPNKLMNKYSDIPTSGVDSSPEEAPF